MTLIAGFELLREEDIPELKSKGKLYRHVQSGAELLSLENEDENKVFGITFRTPPTDSSGTPHIMEHSVLCGSRKYPVKAPFVQLMKGSLNTFLNAFTYPDRTCYPVASQNLKDFYNLVDVYLDAVFYPLITPETLKQEGWHYELEEADGPISYKGVVFNEMKGVFSSPEGVLEENTQHAVFPDNIYRHNGGGDPAKIPGLTYKAFTEFHQTYYHPSNARIFFYGDDNPSQRLVLLNQVLQQFQAIKVASEIDLQPRFSQPRQFSFPYEVSADENEQKSYVTVNWLLTESSDPQLRIGLSILNEILIGTAASPLRKALIDSSLGEDLVGGGLGDELRQVTFGAGLKGVAKEDQTRVEPLMLDTLQQLVSGGIDSATVAAALNTIEFQLRENNTGSYPRGLIVMLRALTTWVYDRDPFTLLHLDNPLAAIQQKIQAGEPYFENLINTWLLDNPHRVTVTLEPDVHLAQQRAKDEQTRLDAVRARMSPAELQQVLADTVELKRLQEKTDSPEALATIPTLTLADLDREPRKIPTAVLAGKTVKTLYHDLFTNGILYLDLGFNLHSLPQEWLPFVPLFGRALTEMGTADLSYVELIQRIGQNTGGIFTHNLISSAPGRADSEAWLVMRAKAMASQAAKLVDIVQDILLKVNFDDQERFRQMVLEEKASMESGLVNAGHRVVSLRLKASFNEAGWISEKMGGVSYLLFLRQLVNQIETDWAGVLRCLDGIRTRLVNRSGMIANVTLDAPNWAGASASLDAFFAALPAAPFQAEPWQTQQPALSEGLTIPSQVNFVGKGGSLFEAGYQLDGSILAVLQVLNTSWMWEKVRVQGGAYGGFAGFDIHSGYFSYLSYRDPNLLSTLQSYDQTPDFLRQNEIDPSELLKSIIGAIGDLDAYQLPDAKGYTGLTRHLLGLSDEWRQNFRTQLLDTRPSDFKALVDGLQAVADKGRVVVLGAAEPIQAANAERPGWLAVQKIL